MLARKRALLSIAVLGTLACNLDNTGDAPPRGLLYFPNAIALSRHDATTPASHLYVANSNFDLRYRNGSVQSYSLDKLQAEIVTCRAKRESCRTNPACVPSDCIVAPENVFESEVLIGSFSTSIALSSDGSSLLVATRTDETLSFVGLDPVSGAERGCGGNFACAARLAADSKQRSEALEWPANPVALRVGPLTDWLPEGSALAGDYVLVAHRTGAVSLFAYRSDVINTGADAPGELILTDVLKGLPLGLTEIAYDPITRLAHISMAGSAGPKQLARVGVAIPEGDVSGARLYNAGTLELSAVQPGNDTRDVSFVPAAPGAGAALSAARALVVSSDPSALLVVDVDPTRNPARVGRVERAVAVGVGPERIVTGVIDGRPLAVVACFLARQLFIVDLTTMLTRSVVPNLSGPFDLALDEARKLVYVTDFRSSVIRVIDLAAAVDDTQQGDEPAHVVATVGQPQVLPELQ